MFLPGDPLFLAALAIVVVAFYAIPAAGSRLALLIVVSLSFYASFSLLFFIPLIWILTVAYTGAIIIEKMPENDQREKVFWLLVVLSLMPLLLYKYVGQIALSSVGAGYDWSLAAGRYAIPIGLSYYTFAGLGYVCDIYLGVMKVERRLSHVALYLFFFGHVVAGPIPRATALLPQIDFHIRFDASRIITAIRLILVGACMKLWIADSLSSTVNLVYRAPQQATALENLIACQVFAFQLYADFAGYSLIAIGCGLMFGLKLGENFRQPFLSPTLIEFWRSWHISLFTWLRDYVFTPLRMTWRRWPMGGQALAILITLVLVGIWHGTGWGFLAYGTVHGVFLVASIYTLPLRTAFWKRTRIPMPIVNILRIVITFTIVSLSLILIRAKNIHDAVTIYRIIFSPMLFSDFLAWGANFRLLAWQPQIVNTALIVVLVMGDILAKRKMKFDEIPQWVMAPVYGMCMLAILYQAITANVSKPFVYLQF